MLVSDPDRFFRTAIRLAARFLPGPSSMPATWMRSPGSTFVTAEIPAAGLLRSWTTVSSISVNIFPRGGFSRDVLRFSRRVNLPVAPGTTCQTITLVALRIASVRLRTLPVARTDFTRPVTQMSSLPGPELKRGSTY